MNRWPRRRRPAHTGVHHLDQPVILLVTVCARRPTKILACPRFHELLLHAWDATPAYRVGRYVIMPDHLHLFCSPNMEVDWRLQPWVSAVKSHVTRHWPDRPVDKFWQSQFWDRQMRSADHYVEKLDYVFQNPVRAGLVQDPEEWPYKGRVHELAWD